MNIKIVLAKAICVLFVACVSSATSGSDTRTAENQRAASQHTKMPDDSPKVEQSYPDNVYWGDTHLHTNLSMDAYNQGNRNLGPEQAYRFAKGETVSSHTGMKVKLRRPLDFLVIADHAINAGVMQGLEAQDAELLTSPIAQRWAKILEKINSVGGPDSAKSAALYEQLFYAGFKDGVAGSDRFRHSLWKGHAKLADAHNSPGKFTAFIGYEWTEVLYYLHRVVIFKDSAEKAGQVIPFSQYDSNDPEKLWDYLSAYEKKTEGEVLAIPHNSNLSYGFMFALEDAQGTALSKSYAQTRSRWEPLLEVTQYKGDSETHPLLSPEDEFSDFEKRTSGDLAEGSRPVQWRKDLFLNHYASWVDKSISMRQENPGAMRQFEYARSGLKLGLEQQARLGINPFKFGMIGSTDSHTSLSVTEEDNYWKDTSSSKSFAMSAAGLAGVWAEENTRDSLFAAMKRKEVYATTGPRITVRFFGGWNYQAEEAFKPDLANIGYSKGVPMGGDLTHAPDNKSPQFLIRAVKDPDGANLDRVQVIKGWRDTNGELHEKIYNVALSDDRKPNWRGKVKPVGSSVDIASVSYTNTIGDPELAVVWQDPDFKQDELAFYYLRVLQIPTPRWTTYDTEFFEQKDMSKDVPVVVQERAYTSPIWYSPVERVVSNDLLD